MKVKKIAAFVLVLLLVLTNIVSCAKEKPTESISKIDAIKKAGVLIMGTSADYPPNEFHMEIDGVDTIVGFDIDIAKYIADDLGVELKIVDMTFDALLISLQQDEFDMVIAGMSKDEEREKSADFSDPYFFQKQAILVLKENADLYKTPADMAGRKVGVQTGTVEVEFANQLAGEENVVGLVKAQDVVMELKAGKIDIAYLDYIPSLAFAAADDTLIVLDIGIEFETEGQSIAVKKGNTEFLAYINGVLAKMNEQGLIEKYIADAQILVGIE